MKKAQQGNGRAARLFNPSTARFAIGSRRRRGGVSPECLLKPSDGVAKVWVRWAPELDPSFEVAPDIDWSVLAHLRTLVTRATRPIIGIWSLSYERSFTLNVYVCLSRTTR